MRSLVTGGAGFIGSNLVEELIRLGHKVAILDNFSTGKKEFLEEVATLNSMDLRMIRLSEEKGGAPFWSEGDKDDNQILTVLVGDIRDLETCRQATKGADYLFHQAAIRSVPRSVDDPILTNDTNITGTLNLLVASKEAGVKRFISASSSSVYGDQETLPLREDSNSTPISPYGVSKLAGEYYCKVWSKVFGLITCSLRYFNVFGPRQNPESLYSAVIPKFMELALEKRPLEIHWDGLQSRDFTHVKNVVNANILASSADLKGGEVINVASGRGYSVLDIAQQIDEFLGVKSEYQFTPKRAGDVRHTLADLTNARAILKYQTEVDFVEGLHSTIAYFSKKRG